jgi:hypothetical protein
LYDVRVASRVWEVHGVHIHFGEEWCGCGNNGWVCNLAHLSGLANVTGADVPGDVMTQEGPPVLLHNQCMGRVVSAVSDVVVHSIDCLDALVSV